MQIGETIRLVPTGLTGPVGERRCETRKAQVVWVHPLGRYAVVERDTGCYKYREAVRLSRRRGESKHEDNRNHESQGRRGQDGHSAEPR